MPDVGKLYRLEGHRHPVLRSEILILRNVSLSFNMETHENEYQNSKVYRICDVAYTKFYYGSTVQPLAMRMGGHRAGYVQYKLGIGRKMSSYDIFDEFGIHNCKIELVELYPCDSKVELERREGYHIQIN